MNVLNFKDENKSDSDKIQKIPAVFLTSTF